MVALASRAPGMCHLCRRVEVVDGRWNCEACRRREAERVAKVRALAAAEGICVICRKQEATPAMRTCEDCQERSVSHSQMRRDRCLQAGICLQCCRNPVRAEPRSNSCAPCLKKRTEEYRKKCRDEREAMRKDAPERIVDVLETDGGEMDLYVLAEALKMSTRTALRHLPGLVEAGRVRRREDYEIEGTNFVVMYSATFALKETR
jgi:hypothetical protein